MKKFNQLSGKEKLELSVCKREGWSNRKISKKLKCSESTIRYYLKNLNYSKFKKTRGRKKKLTKRDVRNKKSFQQQSKNHWICMLLHPQYIEC